MLHFRASNRNRRHPTIVLPLPGVAALTRVRRDCRKQAPKESTERRVGKQRPKGWQATRNKRSSDLDQDPSTYVCVYTLKITRSYMR
jgi:hypothetical protein